MAAGGGGQRLDSALVAPFPKAIDIKNNIFKSGIVETFKLALVAAALKSRRLYSVFAENDPDFTSIRREYPTANDDQRPWLHACHTTESTTGPFLTAASAARAELVPSKFRLTSSLNLFVPWPPPIRASLYTI